MSEYQPQRQIVGALAAFLERHRWENVEDRVRALAKIHVIDSVAAMLAGASLAPSQSIAESIGLRDVTQFRCNEASAAANAYLHAYRGRVLDYDDVQTTETSTFGLLANPSVPVLSAAMAVAQAENRTGAELLDAYLAGVEVTARLCGGAQPNALANRFSSTAGYGGVGAIVAASKLNRLTRAQLASAITLWELSTAMDPEDSDQSERAAIRDANSVRNAVEAATIAANGLQIYPKSSWVLGVLTPETSMSLSRRLGKPYWIQQPGFAIRPYASNPMTHPAIDTTLAIVNIHAISATDIERIEVYITRLMMDRLVLQPPAHDGELGRCLPLAVALAAVRGVVETGDFRSMPDDNLVINMMKRVTCRVDPNLDALGYERARTEVRIFLRDGRGIGMKSEVAKGSPQKPYSEIELSHKFVSSALGSAYERNADEILNRLWALDELENVSELFACSSRPRAPS